jgi:hypothetical protein
MGLLILDEYLYQSDLTDNYIKIIKLKNKKNNNIGRIMAAPEAVWELQSVYHIC